MNKLLVVARREYTMNIKKPSFLFGAFGVPILIIGFILGVGFLTAELTTSVEDLNQIGYVDQADVLGSNVQLEDYPDLFAPYDTVEAAREALDNGVAAAYFVLESDYLQTGRVGLYRYDDLPEGTSEAIQDFIRVNLAEGQDLIVPFERLTNPTELTLRLLDSGRELDETALIGLLLFPMVFAVVFALATQVTSGFLMTSLVEEKTNRVIELLVTSVKPLELLGGKILGLGGLGLTQLAVWMAGALALNVAGQDLPLLSGISVPLDLIVLGLTYFVLGYFLVASIMSVIGVLSGSEQESRQYAGVISLFLFTPYILWITFLMDPNGTIPVVLSLFPFTAPMAMILRYGITTVPATEIALSLGLMLTSVMFFAWASARLFRWGLLRYGKKFNVWDMLHVLRGRTDLASSTVSARQASGEVAS